ncbi:hypothetical protein GCM10010398_20980 [Streptomyces fimbriatus]
MTFPLFMLVLVGAAGRPGKVPAGRTGDIRPPGSSTAGSAETGVCRPGEPAGVAGVPAGRSGCPRGAPAPPGASDSSHQGQRGGSPRVRLFLSPMIGLWRAQEG